VPLHKKSARTRPLNYNVLPLQSDQQGFTPPTA
jgi:hypothetical protein